MIVMMRMMKFVEVYQNDNDVTCLKHIEDDDDKNDDLSIGSQGQ